MEDIMLSLDELLLMPNDGSCGRTMHAGT